MKKQSHLTKDEMLFGIKPKDIMSKKNTMLSNRTLKNIKSGPISQELD